MKLTEYRLADVCERLSSGKCIKPNDIFKQGLYPVYGGNGFRGYTNNFNFSGKCAIIGRQGAYCGNVQFFKGTGYMTEHAVVVCGNDKANTKYLSFVLSKMQLGHLSHQAAQPGLSVKILAEQKIFLPSIEIQNKIASILSAYDDLIENNRRQIKLLEEAAQRLYKEWFVDLRFPGRESVKIIDGVPEGWRKITVAESLLLHINGGWGKESATANNIHIAKVIRGTDINDIKAGNFSDLPNRYHTDNDITKKALKINDIIFELSNGNIQNIGRTLLIDNFILENCGTNTICASFCKLFRAINKEVAILLNLEIQEMQSDGRIIPYKKQGANGINNFAFEDFLNHTYFITKDRTLMKNFESILSEISIKRQQIHLASEARDRLLPKLMSGEIDVSERIIDQ